MTPDRWIALLGIAVAVLSATVPVIVVLATRRADRDRTAIDKRDAVIDKQAETIQRQRDAIFDYKISLAQLNRTAELVTRTVEALPIPQPERDGT